MELVENVPFFSKVTPLLHTKVNPHIYLSLSETVLAVLTCVFSCEYIPDW